MGLMTVRMLLLVRGRRALAAAISFFEILLFVFALGLVMQNLDNIFNILAYAGGFACGCLVGGVVEEKLALGYESVQIIPGLRPAGVLVNELRENGFGVTVVEGMGRLGPRNILFMSVKRKALGPLMKLIGDRDPDAFVTVFETKKVKGGVFGYHRKGK